MKKLYNKADLLKLRIDVPSHLRSFASAIEKDEFDTNKLHDVFGAISAAIHIYIYLNGLEKENK